MERLLHLPAARTLMAGELTQPSNNEKYWPHNCNNIAIDDIKGTEQECETDKHNHERNKLVMMAGAGAGCVHRNG